MEIFGQIVGFIFAAGFLLLAYKLYNNNKNAAGHLTAVIGALILLCSFPWFQGWAKSFIASKIISKLDALGKQVTTVQETTTAMHTQLDKHQKELDVIQVKIREAESNVFSQQSDITNQFRQISFFQSDLATAQTNIFSQQEKLTNVESLVNSLFSNTEDEELSASDTNKVIILKLSGVQWVVFKLKIAPIPNTIQAIATSGLSTQIPILPTSLGQFQNILFTRFYNEVTLNGMGFHFRYIKNTRANGLVQNMVLLNTNTVSLDGHPVPFY
jgi:hypothetical protein